MALSLLVSVISPGQWRKAPGKYVCLSSYSNSACACSRVIGGSCRVTRLPLLYWVDPKPIVGIEAGQRYGDPRKPSKRWHNEIAIERSKSTLGKRPVEEPVVQRARHKSREVCTHHQFKDLCRLGPGTPCRICHPEVYARPNQ